jgi:hypothetical protein
MSIDQKRLGTVVQEQMQAIEAAHPDEECEIGDVVVITQVRCGDSLEVRIRAAEGMWPNAVVGLIAQALRNTLMVGDSD